MTVQLICIVTSAICSHGVVACAGMVTATLVTVVAEPHLLLLHLLLLLAVVVEHLHGGGVHVFERHFDVSHEDEFVVAIVPSIARVFLEILE